MNMRTCRCIKSDVRNQLERDDHAPTLTVCGSCCRMPYGEVVTGNRFAAVAGLPIEGVSPGQTFGDLVRRFVGTRMSVVGVPDCPTIRALELDGQPVGEIFVIRRTSDGPVMLFPGNSTPWYERVIHPDDIAIGFGIRTEQRPSRERQVWQILCEGLQADNLEFRPRLLFRVA